MKKLTLAALVMFMALSAHSQTPMAPQPQATLSLFLNGERPIVRNMPKEYRVQYFARTRDSSTYFIILCSIENAGYRPVRLFIGPADLLTERIISEHRELYSTVEFATNDYILNFPNQFSQPSVRQRIGPPKTTDETEDEPDDERVLQDLLWVWL